MQIGKKIKFVFVIGSIVGLVFSALFCVFLNQMSSQVNKDRLKKSTTINIAPLKQKKKKLTRKKQLEKKQPSKPSKPRIASQLNQLNFGGAGLNWLSTEDLTDKLAGNMDDLIMTADTVDEIPTLKRSAELNYPESARNSGTQGYVTISFIVTKNGKVKKPSVTNSEPAGIFESYALASIKNWEFNPAKFEGEPVQVLSLIHI